MYTKGWFGFIAYQTFNAKSSLYIFIFKHILLITFLNELEPIF